MYFDNYISSKNESQIYTLKIYLQISINDIDIVIKKAIKICDRQIFKYITILSKIKARFSTRLDKILFVDLIILIIFFVCEFYYKYLSI